MQNLALTIWPKENNVAATRICSNIQTVGHWSGVICKENKSAHPAAHSSQLKSSIRREKEMLIVKDLWRRFKFFML
jgi:hypothetical protein